MKDNNYFCIVFYTKTALKYGYDSPESPDFWRECGKNGTFDVLKIKYPSIT